MTFNLIWDFDGTLVDSYGAIEAALADLHVYYALPFDRPVVMAYVQTRSVGQHLRDLAQTHALVFEDLLAYFNAQQEARDGEISLMPLAQQVLVELAARGAQHFIYTHKGATTQAVLEALGIASYFTEVVTSVNGFARKPAPDALIYLLEKYEMDKARTYYVGDRSLDMEAARNAGIASINLTQAETKDNQKIEALSDLLSLFDAS